MSTSMQLNLCVVWSLEFSIVNSQVNSYIVVHTYLAGFYETVPRISNNFLLLLYQMHHHRNLISDPK